MANLFKLAPHTYRVRAVIFDWAGTIVDYGSRAPVIAFTRIFENAGVKVPLDVVRAPMGMNKRDHIRAILSDETVAGRWRDVHGRAHGEEDIDRLYHAFTPIQIEVARELAAPIPRVLGALSDLRGAGVKIGSCSGYNEPIMRVVEEAARGHGLSTDAVECGNAAGTNGRPAPWMSLRVAERLGVFPLWQCVKVDDTPVGILEGLNAGMWTVGVIRSGNALGMSESEAGDFQRRDTAGYERWRKTATETMTKSGAHFVVDTAAEIPHVVEKINALLDSGVGPILPTKLGA